MRTCIGACQLWLVLAVIDKGSSFFLSYSRTRFLLPQPTDGPGTRNNMRSIFRRAKVERDASSSSAEDDLRLSQSEEKQQTVDITMASTDLEKIKQAHQWDPNLPKTTLDAVERAIEDEDAKEMVAADRLFTEESPYEEVRAAVRNVDGGEVANTVRAWIIGLLFVTVASGANMFLSMRTPAISMRLHFVYFQFNSQSGFYSRRPQELSFMSRAF